MAEVLDLPTSRIRAWARQGLLTPVRGPGGAYRFSFQDVALLRAARDLLDADLSVRKVREALERLRDQLPVGRPLSAVRLSARGDRVLVEDGDRTWEPDTGQLHLALDERAGAGDVDGSAAPRAGADASAGPVDPADPADAAPIPFPGSAEGPHGDADAWYDRAVDLEAHDPAAAKDAYARALALAPDHPDAHLNLGRLLHEEGALEAAEHHYRQALSADPESARAFYNLGVALQDKGRSAGAAEAYETALRLDPDLAVAHFNLSRVLEAAGRETDALNHLAAYKRLLEQGGREA